MVIIPMKTKIFPNANVAIWGVCSPLNPTTTVVKIRQNSAGISVPIIMLFLISFLFLFKTIFASGIEKKDIIENKITPNGRRAFFGFMYDRFDIWTLLEKTIVIESSNVNEIITPAFSNIFSMDIPFQISADMNNPKINPIWIKYFVFPNRRMLMLSPVPIVQAIIAEKITNFVA